MEYKRFHETLLVRIDRDEEIHEQLRLVAQKENIRLASVTALGAVKEFDVGVFDTGQKKYFGHKFAGLFEIVSLTGKIITKDGQYYPHLHMSAADDKGSVFGGHLNRAVVSATCEMLISVIDGTVSRYFDEEIGLNLFAF